LKAANNLATLINDARGLQNMKRRELITRTLTTTPLAALLAGMPKGYAGAAYASDAPERADMKFGIIALTDCASIVMAHELGYFKKFGINSTVSKEASWAVVRDKLTIGDNQATHMLFGMPFASTMGLGGSPQKPIVVPWLINRNGQAITLANKLKGAKTAADVKKFVMSKKGSSDPATFAMTFPPGTHAMWMRYWLASGGIHPDKDVSLITIPPPQMVANMKVDKMDGFCVGEPWNARAIADNVGFTVTTTQKIWPDHPEKVCAFTEEFMSKNPKTVKAVLKALHMASEFIDNMGNRAKVAETISKPSYINCPKEVIAGRLQGMYDMGDGRKEQDPNYMIFSKRGCNAPTKSYGLWWLSQFRRWGMVSGPQNYKGIVDKVLQPGIYMEAMKEIGLKPAVVDLQPVKLMDGVFNPKDPEGYAKSFAINNLKG
jgi:nitrate/nitrite transport system substrate-binding protein